MSKVNYIIFFLFGYSISVFSQIGGDNAYKFLSIPTAARATKLGGTFNSIYDNDPSLAFQNPATLNPELHKNIVFNYSPYFGGSTLGNINYIVKLKPATFQFGATYINYGQLDELDEFGNKTGLVNANEIALQAGAGRSYRDKYKFGANAKFLLSQLDEYTSAGIAIDLAAIWVDTAHNINLSLNFYNLGFQFKPYTQGNQELLPVDVQFSFSHRLKHVPIRFIVTAHRLYQWDIRYDNPNNLLQSTSLFEEEREVKPGVKAIDNIARHLIFAGEFYFGKAVTIGFGYNHLRRAELAIPSVGGLAGFSLGFGVKIKRFKIDYSVAKYALPSSLNQLTLSIDLSKSIKHKKIKKKELESN